MLFILFMLAVNHLSLLAEDQISRSKEKGWLGSTLFFLLDEGGYTFDIYGAQIYPNDQLKYSIMTEHDQSVYNIPALTFEIMGHTINSSNVQINVQPTMTDETKTRLNLEIYAAKADVTGPSVSKSYNNLEIKSLYGI